MPRSHPSSRNCPFFLRVADDAGDVDVAVGVRQKQRQYDEAA
jgi:hypothetical protein